MSPEAWAYVKWRFDDLYWQVRTLCVVGPPFLAFLIVRAMVEGHYGIALILVGALCVVLVYFFLPFVLIKAYRKSRWYARQAENRSARHRGRADVPWNGSSSTH